MPALVFPQPTEDRGMAPPQSHNTYRVIGVRRDGTTIFVQGNLSKAKAESVRGKLFGIFQRVVIEAEALTVRRPDPTPDGPADPG